VFEFHWRVDGDITGNGRKTRAALRVTGRTTKRNAGNISRSSRGMVWNDLCEGFERERE
jgi:hypothetical protein